MVGLLSCLVPTQVVHGQEAKEGGWLANTQGGPFVGAGFVPSKSYYQASKDYGGRVELKRGSRTFDASVSFYTMHHRVRPGDFHASEVLVGVAWHLNPERTLPAIGVRAGVLNSQNLHHENDRVLAFSPFAGLSIPLLSVLILRPEVGLTMPFSPSRGGFGLARGYARVGLEVGSR